MNLPSPAHTDTQPLNRSSLSVPTGTAPSIRPRGTRRTQPGCASDSPDSPDRSEAATDASLPASLQLQVPRRGASIPHSRSVHPSIPLPSLSTRMSHHADRQGPSRHGLSSGVSDVPSCRWAGPLQASSEYCKQAVRSSLRLKMLSGRWDGRCFFPRRRDLGPGAYLFVVLGISTCSRAAFRGSACVGKPKYVFCRSCLLRGASVP